ncbi:MAG: DUF1194 domain-containing protein [Pseudomonadota bacterium]
MRRFLILILIYTLSTFPTQAQSRPVALELILAVDTSTSVDEQEFLLQRQGLAFAFSHPDLIAVIEGMGETGIAVSMVEWAGTGQQDTVIEWTLVNSQEASLNLAARINEAPRRVYGMTDIGSVIQHSVKSFEQNNFVGSRKVIDISGDGTSNTNSSVRERDFAISRGITINGLVIFNREYDLGELAEVDLIQHYSNQVIGGNGAFLMTAKNFEDFRVAILNKLIREILGTATAQLPKVIE